MTCLQCGSAVTSARETVNYDAMMGLPVTLKNIEVRRCASCGEYEVVIQRAQRLMEVLAGSLIRKPSRLSGDEVRFLRKYLGWSGADFARHIGATPETVSRWENDAATIGGTADRALRLMVATARPVHDYSLDTLEDIANEAQPVERLGMLILRDDWQMAHAAIRL